MQNNLFCFEWSICSTSAWRSLSKKTLRLLHFCFLAINTKCHKSNFDLLLLDLYLPSYTNVSLILRQRQSKNVGPLYTSALLGIYDFTRTFERVTISYCVSSRDLHFTNLRAFSMLQFLSCAGYLQLWYFYYTISMLALLLSEILET